MSKLGVALIAVLLFPAMSGAYDWQDRQRQDQEERLEEIQRQAQERQRAWQEAQEERTRQWQLEAEQRRQIEEQRQRFEDERENRAHYGF